MIRRETREIRVTLGRHRIQGETRETMDTRETRQGRHCVQRDQGDKGDREYKGD